MINLNDTTFHAALTKSDKPSLVYFRAGFCGPSSALDETMIPIVEDFAVDIAFVEVDVEECPKTAREFSIKGTPTLMFFEEGVPKASRIGTMSYRQCADWLEELLVKK